MTPLDKALDFIDKFDPIPMCAGLVAIPSPTGAERRLAEHIHGLLTEAGVPSRVQDIDADQANVLAELRGGDGASLLVCAGLDTMLTGDPVQDQPLLGDDPRADFRPTPLVDGETLVGLGAENPKGLAAAAVLAMLALRPVLGELRGAVRLALSAGSMPYLGRSPQRRNIGGGSGLAYLLDRGHRADFALILKPGYRVDHEEVGQEWFRLTVHGSPAYTGSRHKATYDNPILAAARLIPLLDDWITRTYTPGATRGTLEPQGSINAIRGGMAERGCIAPAALDLVVDLRTNASAPVGAVRAQVEAAVKRMAGQVGVSVTVEPLLALGASATPPDSWIVRSAVAAWEAQEGRPHPVPTGNSSASDGGLLRRSGIPTAKIGLPRAAASTAYPGLSMGVVDAAGIRALASLVARIAIDTCSRRHEEIERS